MWKRMVLILLLLAGGFALYKSELGKLLLSGNIHHITKYIHAFGWKAVLLVTVAILIQTFFPFMPFIILASVNVLLFGLKTGFLINWVAVSLGAVLAFLAARYFARDWAERKAGDNEYIRRFQQFAQTNGFKAILIARIIAVVPSSMINLAAGFSPVTLRTFALATFIGNFPVTFVESLLGHYLIHFEKHSGKLLILLVLLALGYYLIKKRMKSNDS